MDKSTAITLLGGTVASAARKLKITPSAIYQWPNELTEDIEMRVLAALAREHLPPELLGAVAPVEPAQGEA